MPARLFTPGLVVGIAIDETADAVLYRSGRYEEAREALEQASALSI